VNWVRWHLGDYAAATAHLTWEQDLAYRRLLDVYYRNEAPLPAAVAQAARIVRATTPRQVQAVEAVLQEFFTRDASGWRHARCDAEIARAAAQAESNRRVAEERERKRRASAVHESLNESSDESLQAASTNRSPSARAPRTKNQEPRAKTLSPPASLGPPQREGEKRTPARATRLPPGWKPDAVALEFARGRGLSSEQVDEQLASFTDYWTAKAGAGATKADWLATWRNWIRRATEGKAAPSRRPGDLSGMDYTTPL
jgi:uncharacterized protein YdaU (DUF1376 family)